MQSPWVDHANASHTKSHTTTSGVVHTQALAAVTYEAEGDNDSGGGAVPAPPDLPKTPLPDPIGPGDVVAISPNSPPSSLTPGQIDWDGASTLKPTNLDDLTTKLNNLTTDTDTLVISGHGGGDELPGTSFGKDKPSFYNGNIPDDLVVAIHHALGSTGVVVIDSCQDTKVVNIENYQLYLQQLADLLGYPVVAAYGSTYWNDDLGIYTDGQWLRADPTPGSGF